MTRARRLVLCASAIALILIVDAARAVLGPSVYPLALLDWSAHGATAVMVLAALSIPLTGLLARVAVATAVLLDADHLPAHLAGTMLQYGRPPTHSLTTAAAMAVVALAVRGRAPVVVAGAATGVTLHLLRDAATGPGFVSWPPLTDAHIRVPYVAYLAVLVGCVACAAAGPTGQGVRRGYARSVAPFRTPAPHGAGRTADADRPRHLVP